MALVCFAEIRSRIKGHHVYDSKYLLKEELECVREPTDRFSSHAIVVKPKKIPLNDNKGKQKKQTKVECDKTVGHVPDSLAEILSPLMATWKILSVTAIVESNHRAAPEGIWVPDGGTEIPCTYKLYGAKLHKKNVRDVIKKAEKSLFVKYGK